MKRCSALAAQMTRRQALQVLGLAKNSSKEDVKTAFRSAAKTWHPDHNSSPEAQAKFQELRSACDVLESEGHEERRFGPVLGPRAEHGDSLFAQQAEGLGLRRGVLLTSQPSNANNVVKKAVVLLLSIGADGDWGVLLNRAGGNGGPDRKEMKTILHGCLDLAEQGPVTNDQTVFAESGLDAKAADAICARLTAEEEPYVLLSGFMRWGAWELQEEVKYDDYSVHEWTAKESTYWLREGRLAPYRVLWERMQSFPPPGVVSLHGTF